MKHVRPRLINGAQREAYEASDSSGMGSIHAGTVR